MTRFTAINLYGLPAPKVIEEIDYEVLLDRYRADIVARKPDLDRAVKLEQSPTNIVLETIAYGEMITRQRVNQAARSVLLAYATGTDLEHLGSLLGVVRLVSSTGVTEEDTAFRKRIQLALEAFSTAGPSGAYEYHARSADYDVKDVAVYGPDDGIVDPGQVLVAVLARTGNGAASPALVTKVHRAISAKDKRPIADEVLTQAATIVTYAIQATLQIGWGPDAEAVRQDALQRITAYVSERHLVGSHVPMSGIMKALQTDAVDAVSVTQPPATVDPGLTGAPFCTGITLTTQVVG